MWVGLRDPQNHHHLRNIMLHRRFSRPIIPLLLRGLGSSSPLDASPLRLLLSRAMTTQQLHTHLNAATEAAGLSVPDISPDLLSRLKDPTLLHSAGFIGGKWVGAHSSATYEVGQRRRRRRRGGV